MKRLLPVLLLGLLWSQDVFAQITHNNSGNSGVTDQSAGVLTFSATVNAGSNRILFVCATARDGAALSAVTFNTTETLTLAIEKDGGNGLIASLWYRIAPTVTTANITIAGAGETFIGGVYTVLNGAKQTSPIEDTDTLEFNGANPVFSGGLVSATDLAAAIDCMQSNATNSNTMNAETNRVERANLSPGTTGRLMGESTIITKSPAGSVTMGWNIEANNAAYVGAIVLPAAAGSSTTQNLGILLGAGR